MLDAPLTETRCLSVIMPVYNEGPTVTRIIERVLAQPEVAELVIVNDCSTDDTWAVLAKTWDDRQLLEFPILVGQYLGVAYQQNSLRNRLMPGHVGLSAR